MLSGKQLQNQDKDYPILKVNLKAQDFPISDLSYLGYQSCHNNWHH